jgi:bacillithiol biosynthesis cysteine-adding enzyme BshC
VNVSIFPQLSRGILKLSLQLFHLLRLDRPPMSQPATHPACIRHTDLPGTSRLFADFSYHFDRVAPFFRHDPFHPRSFTRAAGEIDYPNDRRAALVEALRAQNGASAAIDKLAEPGTVAVVTGQQVGLFTGPAYTIYKALTAARKARELSLQGIPAVPVFWLATEDHDIAEVNHAWVFDSDSNSRMLRVDAGPENGVRQRPVGGVPVPHPPVAELRKALAHFPYSGEVVAAVEEAYAPGVTMGRGFRDLLKALCRKLELIFVDPLDPALREIASPLIARALDAAPELKAGLLARTKELVDAGYHAQVHIDAKTSLFFLLENGERVPLRRKDSEYGGLAGRAAEVSPNALLRPVMQDYLLPTVAYVGGPGEIAYLAQSQVIYERLLGRMPVVMPRAGFTLIDARSEKLLDRYDLHLGRALIHPEALKERIASTLVPASLRASLESASEHIRSELDRVKTELEGFDETLAAATEKSRAKIVYQLEKIRRKTERETLRRDQRAESDAQHLSCRLFPHRHLQERFYSILPFLAEHGLDLVDRLHDAVHLDCPDHQIYVV